MAYSTINKPTDHFNTKLYTGTGSTQNITGVGHQPDWVWIKGRSIAYDNNLFDAVRGTEKRIKTNATSAQDTVSGSVTAFGTDGFTVGADAGVNANTETFVSWNWKANGAGSANTDGDINSTVSVNQTAGFSIVKYTGNGSTNQTVGHGLNTTPKFKIIKSLGATSEGAVITGAILGSTVGQRMFLNTNAAVGNPSGYYTLDNATTLGISGSNNPTSQNANGEDYIAYCFTEKTGYSKFGSYRGDGQTTPRFIYTGFKPAFLLIKRYDSSGDWQLVDNKRDIDNPTNKTLFPNLTNAEDSADRCDLLSNGFAIRSNTGTWNASSSGYYIYMAFAKAPLVGSNNVPCTAR